MLVEKDDYYIKSEAVLRIADRMGGSLSYLSTFGMCFPTYVDS